MFHVEHFSGTA